MKMSDLGEPAHAAAFVRSAANGNATKPTETVDVTSAWSTERRPCPGAGAGTQRHAEGQPAAVVPKNDRIGETP